MLTLRKLHIKWQNYNSISYFFSSSSCISEFFDAREYASHSDDSSDEEEDNEIEDDENEANSTDDEQVSFRFFPILQGPSTHIDAFQTNIFS